MSTIPYTYCVVKYVHDPAAGEVLNVGVVLWAPSEPYLGSKLEFRYERLSSTFVGFDGESYKRVLRQLESALDDLREDFTDSLFSRPYIPDDVKGLINLVWPDEDLSFQTGPMLAGIAENPESALNQIFVRFVESQYPREKAEARSNEEVWTVYHRPLVAAHVSRILIPKNIVTEEVSLKFNHAFKNGSWHILEPLSMDNVKPETIQHKATAWLGNAMAIKGHPELAKLYLLLGKPHIKENYNAYEKAKSLLRKMPVNHKLIEEDEAEEFAEEMAEYMRTHGILEPNL